KQLLMNTILRVLEQHGRLTYLELTYRMKFRKGNTITNYDRGRIIRYLLLSKKSESSTTRQLRNGVLRLFKLGKAVKESEEAQVLDEG
ncbi:hypothetical protein KAT42_03445, partial [Candidatus Bathyarchaeota archaeon]|nr:hypothetical protein [Candidatus Bathyarchaeota archaeon]